MGRNSLYQSTVCKTVSRIVWLLFSNLQSQRHTTCVYLGNYFTNRSPQAFTCWRTTTSNRASKKHVNYAQVLPLPTKFTPRRPKDIFSTSWTLIVATTLPACFHQLITVLPVITSWAGSCKLNIILSTVLNPKQAQVMQCQGEIVCSEHTISH